MYVTLVSVNGYVHVYVYLLFVHVCTSTICKTVVYHLTVAMYFRLTTIIYALLYIYNEKYFSFFLYSPCPNLEGIKDALSYKFRRHTIGQNCCAVCTNEVARA